jgi:hypothetical protein
VCGSMILKRGAGEGGSRLGGMSDSSDRGAGVEVGCTGTADGIGLECRSVDSRRTPAEWQRWQGWAPQTLSSRFRWQGPADPGELLATQGHHCRRFNVD